MNLQAVIPENFKMDGGACFGVVPRSVWSKHVSPDENNMIRLSSRCLLISSDNRNILIDTGIGNKQSEKYYGYFGLFDRTGLKNALKHAGFKTSDITDVILTHLHFDHCGGAVEYQDGELVPVFQNAKYYCSKQQWDNAHDPNPREAAAYHPENYDPLFVSGCLELIENEGKLTDDIYLELKNGHTPGQIIPIIDTEMQKIVFTADFISQVFNIPLAYVPAYDTDPLLSMNEKRDFLNKAVENDYTLFFEHDYMNECCKLIQTEKGVRAGKIFNLSDIINREKPKT